MPKSSAWENYFVAPLNHRRNPLLRSTQPRTAVSEKSELTDTAIFYPASEPHDHPDEPVPSAFAPGDTAQADSALQFAPPPATSTDAPALPAASQAAPAADAVDVQREEWFDPADDKSTFQLSPLSLGLRVLFDLLLIGAALFVLHRPDPQPIALQPPPTAAPTATATALPTPGPITVFVSGAVREPALYRVAPDARVADAIAMAGGLLDNADSALLNQAEQLFDGAQIHVPANAPQLQTGDAQSMGVQTVGALSQPAAGVSGNAAATGGGGATSGGLININTASVDALTSLPGIGPSKAANIVAGRPYATVDELERVSGIGAKTVEQLRELVTVQ